MHENRTTGQRRLRLDAATLILTGVGVVLAAGHDPAAPTPLGAARQVGNARPAGAPVPEDMVRIPGGRFQMGYREGYDDEQTVHEVKVSAFLLDRHEVTNGQFAAFVEATGHVTQAEKDGYCWAYIEGAKDFQALSGADWRHPQGPTSSIEEKTDHPVVCVSWHDADTYARWAGKRLPTEASWEYAARAGSPKHFRAMTDARREAPVPIPDSHHGAQPREGKPAESHGAHGDDASQGDEVAVEANVWQGTWPTVNRVEDGFFYTAPVGSYRPNAMGLHDVIGNVWEWTADWYSEGAYRSSVRTNPAGPSQGEHRVVRGGSWFCSPNYCGAYSTHYRGASPPHHAFNNVGFRCAADLPQAAASKGEAS